jgi:LPS-assembly protein
LSSRQAHWASRGLSCASPSVQEYDRSRSDGIAQGKAHNPMTHLLRPGCLLLLITVMALLGPLYGWAVGLPSVKKSISEESKPWEISAKSLSYDREAEVYVAEGDVVITKGDVALHAQKAVYHRKTGQAEVSGGVRLESGGDTLTGDSGTFDLNTQTGSIMNGTLFLRENHYYISGARMEKLGDDTYLVKEARLTTCDGSKPDWTITGSEVKVTLESYGTIKDAAFRIREIPVFYSPYLIFPGKQKRQTGLLPPRLGYSSRNGLDTEIPFFWAISDQVDATLYERYLSQRGYMQGLELRYLEDKDSKGTFLGDILPRDQRKKDLDDSADLAVSPYPRNNDTRYWLRGRADQQLPGGLSLRFDGDYVSDQDYLREFETGLIGLEARPDLEQSFDRPVDERYAPFRQSAVRISQDRERYALQAASSFYENPIKPPNDTTPQPLMGLNFILPYAGMGGRPLFLAVGSEYDYIWRESGITGHNLWLSPELRAPMWLGPYLEFEPSFSAALNAELHDAGESDLKQVNESAYEVQLRLMTDIERVFDLNWGSVKKAKHRIWPILQYRYRDRQGTNGQSPWFNPIEEEGSLNQVSFSLENYLDGRIEDEKGNVRYHQWGLLTLTQPYDLDKVNRPFAPFSASMTLNPLTYLNFVGSAAWDHYKKEIESADASMALRYPRGGGRHDTYSLSYERLDNGSETLNLSAYLNLAYGFSVGGDLSRNLQAGEDVSNRTWLAYDSQCWGVRLALDRGQEVNTYMVYFRLRGLGEFKAW